MPKISRQEAVFSNPLTRPGTVSPWYMPLFSVPQNSSGMKLLYKKVFINIFFLSPVMIIVLWIMSWLVLGQQDTAEVTKEGGASIEKMPP